MTQVVVQATQLLEYLESEKCRFVVNAWEERKEGDFTLLTEKHSQRTLTVAGKDVLSSVGIYANADDGMIEHITELAHATHYLVNQLGDVQRIAKKKDGLQLDTSDEKVSELKEILVTYFQHLVHVKKHGDFWSNPEGYTMKKKQFPPLPLLEDVLHKLRQNANAPEHLPSTSSLRPPGESSSQRTPAASSQQTPAQRASAQRTSAQRTTRSASKRARENDTVATPAAAAPASTTPDGPEGPLSTLRKRQRESPDVQAELPVQAESPAEVSPDHRADDMSRALAMVTDTRFDNKLELENQVSDLREKMEQHRAEMTALKESMQSIQQSFQALRTELQNQAGPSVQQRPLTGAANAASAPATGAVPSEFSDIVDIALKRQEEEAMLISVSSRDDERYKKKAMLIDRNFGGTPFDLYFNLTLTRSNTRFEFSYAAFRGGEQIKLESDNWGYKHTMTADDKYAVLKNILEGKIPGNKKQELLKQLPDAPVAVQPPDNASRQNAPPTPRTKAIAEFTETMQENNNMMRRWGQFLGFRSPMAKAATPQPTDMPPPSPRQVNPSHRPVNPSPLGRTQGDAAVSHRSPQQARSPTSGGATTRRSRSTSGDKGGKRKSPQIGATTQRSGSTSGAKGGKRKSSQTRGDSQPRRSARAQGDEQSVPPRRSPRLKPEDGEFSLNPVPTGPVESNDLRATPSVTPAGRTWLKD